MTASAVLTSIIWLIHKSFNPFSRAVDASCVKTFMSNAGYCCRAIHRTVITAGAA